MARDTPTAYEILDALHDGTVVQVAGQLGGRVSLRVDIEYLAETLEPGSECLTVHLDGGRRVEYEPYEGGGGPVSLLMAKELDLTILSVDAGATDSSVTVHCSEGRMDLEYDSISFETESGASLGVEEVERACALYWLRWTERGRAKKIGMSLREASPDEMPVLQGLYTKLLEHLALFNPNVDPASELQDDWLEKPGVLFAYLFWVDGDPEPAGFALVGGARLCEAMGVSADFLMWEFLVAEKHRRRGLGSMAVTELLDRHRGRWSLVVLPNNSMAMGFWARCLGPYGLETLDWVDEDGVTFSRHRVTSGVEPSDRRR